MTAHDGVPTCSICFRAHEPHCNAEWDDRCIRCGRAVGGPADGVPDGVCWRCHMGFVEETRL